MLDLQEREVETPTVDSKGKIINTTKHRVQSLVEVLAEGDPTLEMMAIPSGKFLMGGARGEAGKDRELPQHEVAVRNFFLARYPVTQAQWRFVASLPPIGRELNIQPSHFNGDNRPVEQVDWWDAIEFCARLSQHLGQVYRLPSEAEWEYACRAGTTTPFHFGETLTSDIANFDANQTYGDAAKGQYRERTTDVGAFLPNAFGLQDMHGNVWEWCADPWHEDYKDAPVGDRVWDEKAYRYEDLASNLNEFLDDRRRRLVRGGSWNYNPRNCRSAYRYGGDPSYCYSSLGFRVCRSAPRT